ncbi:MAG: hypothetical protein JO084_15535 [Bradyrhizobiaceae bacterium]|nr:hypothetical protein [Hyphomicrobiales bacterium]MBV9429129.1 hypothetical protein [Bradyrhizobiaceae bacterium]
MTGEDDFVVTLDFTAAQHAAEGVRELLLRLRKDFDLAPFEYCRKVRIAPLEIPYSHPEITLGTWETGELAVLASYLHEQMHWYVNWYSHIHADEWGGILTDLRRRYPQVPARGPEGAPDEYSTYLHLVVNWLEIEVTSRFFDREQVIAHVGALPYYRWIYRTVIDDWQPLGALYAARGMVPVLPATAMSAEDLTLAGRAEEAP